MKDYSSWIPEISSSSMSANCQKAWSLSWIWTRLGVLSSKSKSPGRISWRQRLLISNAILWLARYRLSLFNIRGEALRKSWCSSLEAAKPWASGFNWLIECYWRMIHHQKNTQNLSKYQSQSRKKILNWMKLNQPLLPDYTDHWLRAKSYSLIIQ